LSILVGGKSRTSNTLPGPADLGDQFIALQKGRTPATGDGRHFGLVVDDKEAARRALLAAGVTPMDGRFLDFRDPWGSRNDRTDRHLTRQMLVGLLMAPKSSMAYAPEALF
jgi:hypothetical protein